MGGLMNELKIQVGELVSYQGKNFIIKQLSGGLKTVILEDLANNNLLNADIKNLLPPLDLNKEEQKNKVKALELLGDEEWIIAQKRLSIIRPILENRGDGKLLLEIAEENNINAATIYRWIEKFENTGQITSLVPEKSDGGKGTSRLSPEVDSIMNIVIEELYLSKQKNPITKVSREIKRRCSLVDLKPPHINTIRNRILAISEETQLRFREGRKIANDKFKPVIKHFPNAEFPLSVVQIDHTLMDIILVDEIYRKPIGRPWITLAIDVYSRIVTGLYISFDPPGALGTGMCVANSILPKEAWLTRLDIDGEWPCWGKMKVIHVDNAKEFRGNMLSRACEEYGINLEWRPVKTPHWGGHIERLLGTLLKEIHTLPGSTFSNPKQRGEYDSEAKAAFTLMDFEKWLITYIVNVYNKRIHSAIGMTPFHKFQEGIYQKTGIPPRIFNEIKVKLDFLPYVERSIQEYGVVIDHIHYFGDVLRKWIHSVEKTTVKNRQKRKFIFKRDPRDISVVFFFDPDLNEYFQIPYRDTSRPPMTLWEHKEILNRLEKSGVKQVDEDLIFQAYEKLREIEERAISKTRQKSRTKKQAKTSHSFKKSIQHEINKTHPEEAQDEILFETLKPKIDFTNIKPFDEIEYESLN
jgi:putative transposase